MSPYSVSVLLNLFSLFRQTKAAYEEVTEWNVSDVHFTRPNFVVEYKDGDDFAHLLQRRVQASNQRQKSASVSASARLKVEKSAKWWPLGEIPWVPDEGFLRENQLHKRTAFEDDDDPPSMFVATLSRRENFQRRAAIRRTWANLWGSVTAKFTICEKGESNEDAHMQWKLRTENRLYHDIIFMSCNEGYHKLTQRVELIIRMYIADYGDKQVLMKVDDDTFIHWRHLGVILSHNWSPSMYAGVPVIVEDVVRDPCCSWYESYDTYEHEKYPLTYGGGPGYLLGHKLIRTLMTEGYYKRLANEDRAVAVWIDDLVRRSHVEVHLLPMPGVSGYSSRDLASRCEYLNATQRAVHDFLLTDAQTGSWGEYYLIAQHHLEPTTINCFADLEETQDWNASVSECFPRIKTEAQQRQKDTLMEGCDCNLCSQNEQWLFILYSSDAKEYRQLEILLNSAKNFKIVEQEELFKFEDFPCFFHDAPRNCKLGNSELCKLQARVRVNLGTLNNEELIGLSTSIDLSHQEINFMKAVFPCAKFVVVTRQGFTMLPAERDTVLENWHHQSSEDSFLIRFSEFGASRVNDLLQWLGVSGCKFVGPADSDHDRLNPFQDVRVLGDCWLRTQTGNTAVDFTVTTEDDESTQVRDRMHFLYHVPSAGAVICSCMSCGTEEMDDPVFRRFAEHTEAFGTKSPPWVSDPLVRFKKAQMTSQKRTLELSNAGTELLALVRDPLERLAAAYKKWISCDSPCYHSDVALRRKIVPQLLRLAGEGADHTECLSFEQFVSSMFLIKVLAKEDLLPVQLMPQHLQCFQEVPIGDWTDVVQVSDFNLANELRKGRVSKEAVNVGCDNPLPIKAITRWALLRVTRDEYQALGLPFPKTIY